MAQADVVPHCATDNRRAGRERARADACECRAYSFPGLKSSLGAAGAAMPSGRGPCGRRRRRGKRSPLAAFEAAWAATDLRLRSGDERRQAIDAAAVGNHRLRLGLRLKLRLRTMLAMLAMFARLLVARLVGLPVALVLARAELSRGTNGCGCAGTKPGSCAEIREALALVVAVLARAFHCRCAAAAGSAGTVPGRRRSGGNNVRHADSNSRRRPGRRKSARRAPAARIFRRRGMRCRGS